MFCQGDMESQSPRILLQHSYPRTVLIIWVHVLKFISVIWKGKGIFVLHLDLHWFYSSIYLVIEIYLVRKIFEKEDGLRPFSCLLWAFPLRKWLEINYRYSARSLLALIFQDSMIVSKEEVVCSSVANCNDSVVTQQAGWASVEMVKERESFTVDGLEWRR